MDYKGIPNIVLTKKRMLLAQHFDSVADFQNLEVHKVNQGHVIPQNNFGGRRNWLGSGIDSLSELKTILADGWNEGVKRAKKIQSHFQKELVIPPQTVNRRRRVHGDHGDEIDMQKVYSGELDKSWATCRRTQFVAKPVIKIMTNIGGNSKRTGDELFYKGVCSAVLTDLLESNGYRVEVIGYQHTAKPFLDVDAPRYTYQEIVFKRADGPLDFNRLLTCTALSGWYRYHGFKADLSYPSKVRGGLGVSLELPPDEFYDGGMNTVTINNVYSEYEAFHKIKATIHKLHTLDKAV